MKPEIPKPVRAALERAGFVPRTVRQILGIDRTPAAPTIEEQVTQSTRRGDKKKKKPKKAKKVEPPPVTPRDGPQLPRPGDRWPVRRPGKNIKDIELG